MERSRCMFYLGSTENFVKCVLNYNLIPKEACPCGRFEEGCRYA